TKNRQLVCSQYTEEKAALVGAMSENEISGCEELFFHFLRHFCVLPPGIGCLVAARHPEKEHPAAEQCHVEDDDEREESCERPDILQRHFALHKGYKKSHDHRDDNECFAKGAAVCRTRRVHMIHKKNRKNDKFMISHYLE